MTAIDHFNLRSFDLNLLLAFDALMQERSVTRAACRLKIQQPAMSHALKALRVLLDDELFVRVGPVMQPTLQAETLAVRVRHLLAQAQEALFEKNRFDPALSTREFRVGLSNELEMLLLPRLMARLSGGAPDVRLLVKVGSREHLRGLLDDGSIDLAVGCLSEAQAWHRCQLLYEDIHLCAFNPRLVPLSVPVQFDAYVRHRHMLISLKDSLAGCLEDALKAAGVRLNVVAAAPHLVALMAAVAEAPLIATLPARILQAFAPVFGLVTSPVPLNLGRAAVFVVWHARSDRDPGMTWLKDLVAECSSASGPVVREETSSLKRRPARLANPTRPPANGHAMLGVT